MCPADLQRDPAHTAEQDVRNNYARLTATLEQLESDLQPLYDSWSVAAQQSYLICKKQWDDAALALSHVLFTVGHTQPTDPSRWV